MDIGKGLLTCCAKAVCQDINSTDHKILQDHLSFAIVVAIVASG